MARWPAVGTWVVVWQRTPSPALRDPREAVVDHVAGMSFTVVEMETTFNRSTGRATARRQSEPRAVEAVRAWLTERSESARRDAIAALPPDPHPYQ